MVVLQNELLFLCTENTLPIQEKKLDADIDGSIKGLEDVAYMPSSKRQTLQAEMADINMEKKKLKHDDPTDLRDRQSIVLYITQKQDDVVSSLKSSPYESNHKISCSRCSTEIKIILIRSSIH